YGLFAAENRSRAHFSTIDPAANIFQIESHEPPQLVVGDGIERGLSPAFVDPVPNCLFGNIEQTAQGPDRNQFRLSPTHALALLPASKLRSGVSSAIRRRAIST